MESLRVEVVYALPEAQDVSILRLQPGSTLADALHASGVLTRHPELRTARLSAGVWGRMAAPTRVLADGDRIEIYRPLRADPKEQRRRRAARRR